LVEMPPESQTDFVVTNSVTPMEPGLRSSITE
jgi:hypothetical protein